MRMFGAVLLIQAAMFVAAARSDAQEYVTYSSPVTTYGGPVSSSAATYGPLTTYGAPASTVTSYSSYYAYPSTTYAPTPTPPYSYYAAWAGPARLYAGYGSNDFPFYGRPYGHAYDPWTWPYMSGSYYRDLAHYYYPPVR
ncbi:hypothetical protein [Singulisphaera sp. PoT]|uniref:hypothetical protein n=1 Tax=Singulisphaera sp. PoT TaxID=3411797 RepID=UPI003BF504CE